MRLRPWTGAVLKIRAQMSERDALIDRIAGLVGVARGYVDAFGRPVELSGRGAPSDPVGLRPQDRHGSGGTRKSHQGRAAAQCPRAGARRRSGPIGRPIFRCASKARSPPWRGASSTRAARRSEGRAEPVAGPDGPALPLPRLAPGYHRLAVDAGSASAEATLIAAPARCWEPRDVAGGARCWGLAAQLYAFRSGENLGIGTYADAGKAAADAGALGASYPRPQPGPCAFRRRPRQDLALFAVLAPVPRDAAHRPGRGPGLRGKPGAAPPRREAHAHRRAARGCSSSITPASGRSCGPSSTRCGRRSRRAAIRPSTPSAASSGRALEDHATFEALSEHFRAEGAGLARRMAGGVPRRRARPTMRALPRRARRSGSRSMPGCNGSRTANSRRPAGARAPPG